MGLVANFTLLYKIVSLDVSPESAETAKTIRSGATLYNVLAKCRPLLLASASVAPEAVERLSRARFFSQIKEFFSCHPRAPHSVPARSRHYFSKPNAAAAGRRRPSRDSRQIALCDFTVRACTGHLDSAVNAERKGRPCHLVFVPLCVDTSAAVVVSSPVPCSVLSTARRESSACHGIRKARFRIPSDYGGCEILTRNPPDVVFRGPVRRSTGVGGGGGDDDDDDDDDDDNDNDNDNDDVTFFVVSSLVTCGCCSATVTMYVQVRMVETGVSVTITTSRTTLIKKFKELVEEKFKIKPTDQRLFFAGKQLENQYRLFDYGINVNGVIQLMVRAVPEKNSPKKSRPKVTNGFKNDEVLTQNCSTSSSASDEESSEEISYESKYFKVGDYVDVKDYQYGAWFMGKLIKIKKDDNPEAKSSDPESPVENDGLIYVVDILKCPEDSPIEVHLQQIRHIVSELLPLNELQCGDKVLTNYNAEYPKERGYWYDVRIKEIKPIKKGGFDILGDVFVGMDKAVLEDCHLMFLNNIYKIKPYQLLKDRTPDDEEVIKTEPTEFRFGPLYCIKCKDDMNKSCKNCGCRFCGGKDNEDKQLMCDECNHPYHMTCLKPPLKEMPEDDWYCPSCKNDENEIVKAGGKLKKLKKKTPESISKSKRDWGKGMACVGRTKMCNTVPPHHFGPVPGVEVGTTWMFRVQVSEAGVHRPPVGGIHGRDNSGAFSIVLSGGYEDDVDNGDEFLYTGSGGRDLSGNKRTALQSCDQKLTRTNKALALNCNAKIDAVSGATSVDWKQGKPVRVVRNYKLKKHSHFAPDRGNRYDGIYKVVKYYPQTGISGFIVWRFVLRRDDPTPAPWTPAGKKRITQLGLKIIYPENFPNQDETKEKKPKLSVSNEKRTLQDTHIDQSNDSSLLENNDDKRAVKKIKLMYKLEKETEKLIIADVINKKYWDDCKELLVKGQKAFLDRVEETFLCICCQEIVYEPITTECSHNICKECLKRSFNAHVFQCPSCRAELGKTYPMKINKKLAQTLLLLFPGYNVDR